MRSDKKSRFGQKFRKDSDKQKKEKTKKYLIKQKGLTEDETGSTIPVGKGFEK